MDSREVYMHTPYRKLLENIAFIALNKINCEIYTDGDALDSYTKDEIKKLTEVFSGGKIKKIAHGPFMDLNAGSYDILVRQLTRKRCLQALEFCKKLGIDNLVLHTGFHPIFYRHHKKDWLGNAVATFLPVVKKAVDYRVRICIENSIDTSPEIPIALIEAIGSLNALACFDIAHYNVFSEKSILECLQEYNPGSIGEIHLSDNKGDFDSHLALGEGNINFREFFSNIKSLKIKPIITVEPHTIQDIPKSLKYLNSL